MPVMNHALQEADILEALDELQVEIDNLTK